MGEPLWDSLYTTGKVLHWMGKYDETNALILLARLLKHKGIDDLKALEVWVENVEGA